MLNTEQKKNKYLGLNMDLVEKLKHKNLLYIRRVTKMDCKKKSPIIQKF